MSARLAPGTLLASTYKVVRLIGVGGMGEVYEASHARLPGRYAVKVLLGEIMGKTEIFQRFQREAEVTSGLRHPNIVQVLDFNVTPDGNPYLVMEMLDGIELAQEIHRVGAMPIERVLDIVGQIASGLAAAHSHKVVHRDLKPQNMFLVKLPGSDREVVKVVDFGISKVREATTKLTMEAAILGTPQYMAPEQAQGRLDEINDRTDQFALAAITYELIAGRPAFAGGSVPSILYRVVHQQPEPLAKMAPNVGPAVEAVVFKALSKSQAERYPSVMAFHTELVHAAAVDRQIHTMQTPSPLWLPPEAAPAAPEAEAPRDDSVAPKLAPTAMIPPTAPTAQIPQVAPTARIVATARLEPAGQAPATTTLGAAAASIAVPGATQAPRRYGLFWAGALALALAAGVGYWGIRQSGKVPVSSPAVPAPPATGPMAEPKMARVLIENAPPGLRVSVDGVSKELPILLPFGPNVHTLLFEAPGYYPTEFHVDGARESRSLVLAMKPIVEGRTPEAAAGDKVEVEPAVEGEAAPRKGKARSRRIRKHSDIITDR
jgi:tRNA A-37 threonylcarbamoyl transferase component Bud32